VRAFAADGSPQQRDEIERFVVRLRERPWIDSALVNLIAHGLRTAVRDPSSSLWEQLREVIRDDEELQARRAAH
jgi:hypothetical protein